MLPFNIIVTKMIPECLVTRWLIESSFFRLCTTRSTPLLVMCGAMELSCMRYGVWDTNLLKSTITAKFVDQDRTWVSITLFFIMTSGDEVAGVWISSSPSPWLSSPTLWHHDLMLVMVAITADIELATFWLQASRDLRKTQFPGCD